MSAPAVAELPVAAVQPEQQSSTSTQWAFRAQKSIGLNTGPPAYSAVSGFDQVEGLTRTFQYSPDGSTFAAAMENFTRLVDTREASTSQVKRDLPVEKVVALEFSPKGSYLSTFERPLKLEDGTGTKNLKIWSTETGEVVASFERKTQEGCFFQFTSDEKYCIRQVSTELQIYEAEDISGKGIVGRLKLEGMSTFMVGPGEKASVAVFCGEKKGQPASVKVFTLASLIPTPENTPAPVSQKTFFKADKIQMKWNNAGTALLFMTSTDVDKTNKSYYGESNLYMMSSRGDFDCRVGLDKEGPIHDFEWNPNGREFIVIYGFMPARAMLFSYRVNVIADLGTQPRNFVAFNPQGRLFCIAGFGNLSGTVDIWDRENLAGGKAFTMDASNSSVCQWSPDGHFLLTATLSPRLRVDNGVKIWHCTGSLVHVDLIEELYQAGWRPTLDTSLSAFPAKIPAAPAPSPSAVAYSTTKTATAKPAGAYRPPGARGNAPSDVYKRLDDGAYTPPMSRSGSTQRVVPGAPPPTNGSAGGKSKRTVPGAAPPASNGAGPGNAAAATPEKASRRKGKKGSEGAPASLAPVSAAVVSEPAAVAASATSADTSLGAADVGGSGGGLEKKLRNLNKKLKAIQDLKDKQARGEKLEQTQIAKIASEQEVLKELSALQ
ncbi:hypothetical protein OC834_000707 [Tilletia horrida]|nr:hypothetical protein OC834_000707 [Tilletia horrida]